MRVGVVGVGAVGGRAARQLVSSEGITEVVLRDERPDHAEAVARRLGGRARVDLGSLGQTIDADVVVLAFGPGHIETARRHVAQGIPVVSVADGCLDVRELLGLDAEAKERDVTVVVGAGLSPGLTCVLARHAARGFDQVEEVHVAKVGTGGPACARRRHRALARSALDWRDSGWVERPGGSGRELCWFPDPVGARDCYRAALPDALLLVPSFPGVQRVTARVGATRRDRLTARLPMLRRPPAEGGPGAVRVEVRGKRGTARAVRVLGAMDRPSVAAGTVAAVTAIEAASGRLHRPGAAGLAELVEPVRFLAELARRGVRAAVFEGAEGTDA